MLTINPDSVPDSPSPPAATPEAPAAAASAPEPQNLEAEAATAEKPAPEPKKPIPMAWVPATLGVGLLIAVVYLGGRIVTAKAHTAPRAPVVAQKVTPATPPAPVVQAQAQIQAKLDPPSPPVIESKPSPLTYPQPVQQHDAKPPVTEPAKAVAEPKPAQSAASEDLADLPTITPQAGERYVQIGALIPKAAHRYLGQLHLAQLKPQIAPGPTPDLVRVVVGPFDDRDVLAAVQAQLDAQGIPNFIRRY